MTTIHKNLTGADLHEPKGADTALAGTIYVADGGGSGAWVSASTVVSNLSFTAGDVKLTYKNIADAGWVLLDGGTIGDGSSSATSRANADCQALFQFLWTAIADTWCPVAGGRGGSAAADFSAHKNIRLPSVNGLTLGIYGGPHALGSIVGSETGTLSLANLPPFTPTGSIANGQILVGGSSLVANVGIDAVSYAPNAGSHFGATLGSPLAITQGSSIFTGNPVGGASSPFSIMQPTTYMNAMIKL